MKEQAEVGTEHTSHRIRKLDYLLRVGVPMKIDISAKDRIQERHGGQSRWDNVAEPGIVRDGGYEKRCN